MEDRERLSRWLYSVLESVGASERLRRLHRQTAVAREILYTIHDSFMPAELINIYICGSNYEGSVTPALASDIDIVHCHSFVPVLLDAAASPPGKSLLMVRDNWTYPGYVKLQWVADGRPLYCYHVVPPEGCDVDNEGRICCKHFNGNNMHGPADMRFDENGVHVLDQVTAFRCDDIPQHALEWIMRPRPYGWPSRDQLQAMIRMGCLVVGVGHMNSGENEIEWRMSYTLQERMLMSSINPVQHKGFSQRIRKGLLKELRKIVESGHQFLYMIQSDNVGALLRNGDWRMYREETTHEKNEYIYKLNRFCIASINNESLNILWLVSNGNYDPFTLTLDLENLKNARCINNHTIEVTQSAVSRLLPWLHIHIANSLASFTRTCPDRAVRERVMKLADFHFHGASATDLVNERLAVASVLYSFEKYEECSLLLHLLQCDFTYNVTRECPCTLTVTTPHYDIRDEKEKKKKIAKMSIRHCIKSMTACCVIFLPSAIAIAPEPLQYEMQRSLGTLPDSRDEKEDFWFDWAVVDAKVFLYFMQYLVNSKLHKEIHRHVARDNLRTEIVLDDQRMTAGRKSWLGHKETAYNLLGWIYMQEEQMVEAYECFQASWKIRPFHNAAKYHMRDLIVRLAGRRAQH